MLFFKWIRFATLVALCCISCVFGWSQTPSLLITQPDKTDIYTPDQTNYIAGSTCANCTLTINGKPVNVYPTGSFAWELTMSSPDTTLLLHVVSRSGASFRKTLRYHQIQKVPGTIYPDFGRLDFKCYPSGANWLRPGDQLQFQVIAPITASVDISNRIPLFRQSISTDSTAVFQGMYTVTASDAWIEHPMFATITLPDGKKMDLQASSTYSLLSQDLVGKTVGAAPYLTYSQGADRLGAAKMGYLDTGIRMHVVGLQGQDYFVELAPNHHAFIPIENLSLLPKGAFLPESMTGPCRIWGHNGFDYVSLGLQSKLPYSSTVSSDPGRIVVRVYGASNNTNWVAKLDSIQEVRRVSLHQVQDGICELDILLKHAQPWGYTIEYQGNDLVIKIKRQPKRLILKNLTIIIDPGHGGENRGTRGPTGIYEKKLTLLIAKDLQTDLRHLGAHVLLTRSKDTPLDMLERRSFIESMNPDLLVSIHLNASVDPIHIQGTSTYYRYPGYEKLAGCILNRMTQIGLRDFGEIGNFNFALNGLTLCPNVLVETAFLSNPSDEMNVLNNHFRQKMADAISAGIQDFISHASGH